MLIINTILLALHATIGASAPVLDGDRMQVEHHGDKSTYWYLPEHNHAITEHLGLRVIVQAVKEPEKVDKAMKGKASRETAATKTTATTKDTAQPHVRRNNNNAQEESGKIGLLESIALAVGIDPKSISQYLSNLRNDFPVQVHGALPTCLNQAARQSLMAIETSLSSIPKCMSAAGDEIELSTDGVEVDADGLPDALTNLGDCATATPLSRT
ncbi:hypothetical protein LCI18_009702 [Fusarium solani-melongenae]|uniref:Uncharacterized protein n=1 Tax=Fusarium solani subsp. cucurbitae TaxID=2747967 RepID=A0ACD3ZCF3_FUSSC|nr:hypothetical protein LCI18_009702 [Fusarium solani-melongenae]